MSGNCSAPPSVFAATVQYTNSTAVYTCNSGYTMNGDKEITCINDTWTGTRPSCSYLITFITDYDKAIEIAKEIAPSWFLVLFVVVSCIAVISMTILLLLCCCHLCRLCSIPFVRHGGKYVYPENIGCCCNACRRKTGHRNLDKQTKSHERLKHKVDEIIVPKRIAKEIDGWRPHSQAIRNINTSTQ